MKIALTALALIASAGFALAQQGDGTETTISATVFKPAKVEATQERVAALKVPDGLKISVFAQGLKNARILVSAKRDSSISAGGTKATFFC